VSRYQKGKTNLDFTEARDSEWQWCQLGHMQVCTSLQTGNHASTAPLIFLQAGFPSCRRTNSVKALAESWNEIASLSPYVYVGLRPRCCTTRGASLSERPVAVIHVCSAVVCRPQNRNFQSTALSQSDDTHEQRALKRWERSLD